ncbi:MAG TPA: hypothetical protein VHS29_09055 [Candidatus Acidoferrales bacterium]|jgi:hypothetical protein|nr:hypothetical protein [Candidatus Acidoferrales bacterium]
MPDSKKHAHELIEKLAPGQLSAVVGLLEVMIDPMLRSNADAPIEDEEILSQTAVELDDAHASIARGEGVSHEEILSKFGMKPR